MLSNLRASLLGLRSILLLALVCSACLNIGDIEQARAFTLMGSANTKGYANPEITIMINQSSCPAGVDLRKIVGDAIEVWNRVSWSHLRLKLGDDTTSTAATMPPTAYCDASLTGGTLGVGGSAINSDGILVGGSLRLNTNSGASGYVLNQSYDRVVIVAAHEIGHLIGIGHSPDSYSLMNYTIGPKTTLNLSQDDIDAVAFLYGRDELAGDQMMAGCGSVSPHSSGSSWPPLVFILFGLPIIVWISNRWGAIEPARRLR